MELSRRAVAYVSGGMHTVSGWFSDSAASLILLINDIQMTHGLQGSMAEIGVHHGKLFILLAALLKDEEKAYALDVFEDQHLNIDKSGHGDRRMFELNIRRHLGITQNIVIVKGDSYGFDGAKILKSAGKIRIFSIDGCHTKEHTHNDIMLAKTVLATGGVIIIDDILNPAWPGVLEGVSAIFSDPGNSLKPIYVGHNKLVVCEKEFFDLYSQGLSAAITQIAAQPSHMEIAGVQTVTFPVPGPLLFCKSMIFCASISSELTSVLSLDEGFSAPEPWGVWTDSSRARASFYLYNVRDGIAHTLVIYGYPFFPSQTRFQEVTLAVNDKHNVRMAFTDQNLSDHIKCTIPPGCLTSGQNALSLQIKHPTSPASQNESEDRRLLGFAIRRIEIFEDWD